MNERCTARLIEERTKKDGGDRVLFEGTVDITSEGYVPVGREIVYPHGVDPTKTRWQRLPRRVQDL